MEFIEQITNTTDGKAFYTNGQWKCCFCGKWHKWCEQICECRCGQMKLTTETDILREIGSISEEDYDYYENL